MGAMLDSEVTVESSGEIAQPADADRRFRVVAIVAGVLFALEALPSAIVFPLSILPTFSGMYADIGFDLPAPTSILIGLGPWLVPMILAIDALIFWSFYRLARKYWIGLLFASLFAPGVLAGLFVWVLYMPMTSVVTLVR